MMNQPPPDADSLADDIVEAGAYEATLPPKKDFLAWHRPRKQFVRDKQWREQIERMLDDAPRSDDTVKYLGLPGVDLLDLRYFHEHVCLTRNLKLRFLGFNTALAASNTQTELNISLDEIRRLGGVDSRSDVIGDDFVRVANEESIAWRRALDLGPFDVLNLDLCNGFAQHEVGAFNDTHYNAVAQLLTLQARHKSPWLFLLTTLAGPEHIHADVLTRLLNRYLANLSDCEVFRRASLEKFRVGDEDTMRASAETEEGLLPLFLCSICKWLAGIALAQNPPSRVEARSVIGYRVHGGAETEDLISIAIRFTPTFVPGGDPVGLADNHADGPSECAIALQALNRVASRKNVDRILRDDPALNSDMADATARLLESARYDSDAYHEWANSFPA